MATKLINVKIEDAKLRALTNQLKPGSAGVALMLKRWGFIYLATMRRRFNTFSRGGGDWPPLAPATVQRKRSQIILKDLGILFNALNPGAPGSTFVLTRDSVQVGIGGGEIHPIAGKKEEQRNAQGQFLKGSGARTVSAGKITIGDLAEIHQQGLGNVPAREILVGPDQPTLARFIVEARRALKLES